MLGRPAWCAVLVALLAMTGCSVISPATVFDDDRVAADALPPGPQAVVADLSAESARLLGEAFGHRYWAVRDEADNFCIVSQTVGEDLAETGACSPGDGGGMKMEGADGVTAAWSPTPYPGIPEGAVLLREHLIVQQT